MTDQTANHSGGRLPQGEFVALMAMLIATVAFSTDAMLPALPHMAADLSPEAPNYIQLVVTSFILGMGVGTLFTGPLSDTFGRKPVVIAGAGLYVLAALAGAMAQSLETMLIARVVQGMAAAAPRVVAAAIVRDLYAGRGMARIMSFIFMVFTLVPAIAPTMGAGIAALGNWHAIFYAFALFSLISATWMALRLPETLTPENRRPFTAGKIAAGVAEVLRHPIAAQSCLIQCLLLGILFITLSTTQSVFDVTFGQGEVFHLWFALIAAISAGASFINSRLVERLGMRYIVQFVLTVQVALSTAYALSLMFDLPDGVALALYVIWVTGLFCQAGLTIGNLNALAMEPLGHMAGLAASVLGSVATVGSVLIAAPVGLAFDGTPRPAAFGSLLLVVLALVMIRRLNRTT